ncbi:hypothetical protein QJS04_geneDACA021604 [Acorus gramineus]|uniref:DCD domain-containing protein n=1 Tax=Acorus gramineus TaxID=55184 RepID=A0AAV9B7T2_ACOGR|nr:hypothetical protein QJS04_geneDACA021604 [Acorus gramineus]
MPPRIEVDSDEGSEDLEEETPSDGYEIGEEEEMEEEVDLDGSDNPMFDDASDGDYGFEFDEDEYLVVSDDVLDDMNEEAKMEEGVARAVSGEDEMVEVNGEGNAGEETNGVESFGSKSETRRKITRKKAIVSPSERNEKVEGDEKNGVEGVKEAKAGNSDQKRRKNNKSEEARIVAVSNGGLNKSETFSSEKKDKENKKRRKLSRKAAPMGLIFMCNAKTKADCFRYKVFGLPASKKEMVADIYKGMRLFLFDVDLKLLYGIYKAAGPGGYNLEPKAFNSGFPSQVHFQVLNNCLPLPEEIFKATIKSNYYGKNKFNCKLSEEQVKDLCKLFCETRRRRNQKPAWKIIKAQDRTYHRHPTYAREMAPYPPPMPRYAYDPPLDINRYHMDLQSDSYGRRYADYESRLPEPDRFDYRDPYRRYGAPLPPPLDYHDHLHPSSMPSEYDYRPPTPPSAYPPLYRY